MKKYSVLFIILFLAFIFTNCNTKKLSIKCPSTCCWYCKRKNISNNNSSKKSSKLRDLKLYISKSVKTKKYKIESDESHSNGTPTLSDMNGDSLSSSQKISELMSKNVTKGVITPLTENLNISLDIEISNNNT